MRTLIVTTLVSLMLLLSYPTSSSADGTSTSIESTTATASVWANFRGKKGSLKFESDRLLKKSLAQISLFPQASENECRGVSSPIVLFSSVPKSFLPTYGDYERCKGYLSSTRAKPLEFGPLTFNDVDSLSKWFSEFSQGEGELGLELYRRCDASCSPQYQMNIAPISTGYSVQVEVICGHARDKDENLYDLSVSYSWKCSKK